MFKEYSNQECLPFEIILKILIIWDPIQLSKFFISWKNGTIMVFYRMTCDFYVGIASSDVCSGNKNQWAK